MVNFTYSDYIRLIKYLKNTLGYHVGPLNEFPEFGNAVILRHDIDFSISKAFKMTQIEVELGVKSTYFVLLTCPFYNPLERKNTKILKEIVHLGGEIGLHYDSTVFEGMDINLINDNIKKQVSILEAIVETKIISISQHKPAKSKIHPNLPHYKNAYDEKYCKDISYISDSRKHFGSPDVYGFFKEPNNRRSQLLIHPIWWNTEDLLITDIFENLRKNIDADCKNELDDFRLGIEQYFKDKR